MTDTVIELAEQYKRALIAKDLQAEKRLISAYQGLYARVRDLADALVLEIAGSEEMTPAQVQRTKRFGELMTRINSEMADYSAFTKVEMSTAAREAIRMGEANARSLIGMSIGDAALAGKFNALNPAVIEKLLGFLDPSGPLYDKLSKLGGWTADQVSQAIIEGVGLGKNPRTTAGMLTKTLKDGITERLGMGLTDSLRMMRTVQLYSYREANRASYVANNDVVKGWIWYADLAGACPSCVAMHGTEHPLTETLDDHHNGRCAMLPLVIGAKNDIQSGADWFEKQSEQYQRKELGDAKYEAWKGGAFKFGELSTTRQDDVYGEMRTTAPLWELLGSEPPTRTK